MPEGLTFFSVIVGFALLTVAGARLGAGSQAALAGLFAANGARDWPLGVQEPDAPHFNFGASPSMPPGSPVTGDPPPEAPASAFEELYEGPLR